MAVPHRTAFLVIPTSIALTVLFCLFSGVTDSSKDNRSKSRSDRLLDLLQETTKTPSPKTSFNNGHQASKLNQSNAAALPTLVPDIPPDTASIALPIRVALLSQSPINTFRTTGGAICLRPDGQALSNKELKNLIHSRSRGWIRCSGGAIRINGRGYRHDVDLIGRQDGWIAVNELDLEQYVASVVGAEMPHHWSLEALKAQAVAARSYALVHLARPATIDYHLGDTTRWQAYGGESTRSMKTRKATQETRGIILSYKGGIVESLYAANRDISAEAHGHLGASMSQEGAQSLASQGLRFNEILGSYYQGASLARLRRDGD